MITYAEALRRLMEKAVPVEGMETVPLLYSTHRVLAEDIVSPIAVPGWDNSQMDGYAVRAAELAEASEDHPVVLPVSDRIPAGQVGSRLAQGSVARIFTGAPMPEGADTVVPQENVEVTPEGVCIKSPVREGAWVRRRGSDVPQGGVVLKKGPPRSAWSRPSAAPTSRFTAVFESASSFRATSSCNRANPCRRVASTTRTAS